MSYIDISGKKFGRITVRKVNVELSKLKGKTYWSCICDCGRKKNIRADNLTSGSTKSCSCLQKEKARNRNLQNTNFVDLTGRKFDRWTVKNFHSSNGKYVLWNCICNCGTERAVIGGNLRSGKSSSCGCLCKEIMLTLHRKHGGTINRSMTREYISWSGAKSRCYIKNNPKYKDYGKRGIKVCDRWLHDYSAFLADMGKCPKGYSLDRIDVNGNYEPSNCRWATEKQQTRNKTNNVWLEYKGKKQILSDWAKEWKIHRRTFTDWLKNGLSMKQIYDKKVNKDNIAN